MQVDGLQLTLRLNGSGQLVSWQEGLPLLAAPEDPNLGYPPGYYLPWPLLRLDWQPPSEVGELTLTVRLP